MARQNMVQQSSTQDRPERLESADGMREAAPTVSAQVGMTADGQLTLVLPPGEVVTGAMAAEAAEEIEGRAGVRRLPLLLTLTGVESITRTARDIFSAARSLSAVAVIGISPVDRVIANFLLGGEVQPCPTRYFSREEDARAWLKRHVP